MFQRVATDLCLLTSDLCLLPFTLVESPLQISYFLCKTNPILSAVGGLQMNATSVKTKNYEQRTMNNEPIKTNPIKPNFKGKKMPRHGYFAAWAYSCSLWGSKGTLSGLESFLNN